MEKREKIDDFEFEGAQNPTEENQEPIEGNQQPIEENQKPQNEESEGKDERAGEMERLFGMYPQTFALIKEEKDFQIDDKMENFMATLEGYARGGGLTAEEIDSSLSMLFSIGNACRKGKPTLDMLEVLMKGQSYDRRLAEEVREAELRGRNANIEAKMRSATDGDGVPHLESRGGGSEKRNRGIFSLAESARR